MTDGSETRPAGPPRDPDGSPGPERRTDGNPPAGAPARNESFPRAHRLTRESEFRTLLARGFRHSTPHLVVHLLANELGHSRLGLTVPRKVGGAVVRNRVRRRVREAFRRGWRFLLADRPADVLVRVVPGAGEAAFSEIEHEGAAAIAAWRRSGFRAGGRRTGGPR